MTTPRSSLVIGWLDTLNQCYVRHRQHPERKEVVAITNLGSLGYKVSLNKMKTWEAKLREKEFANFSAVLRISDSACRCNLIHEPNALDQRSEKKIKKKKKVKCWSCSELIGQIWKQVLRVHFAEKLRRASEASVWGTFLLSGLCLCLAPHCKLLLCTTSQLQTCQRHVSGLPNSLYID